MYLVINKWVRAVNVSNFSDQYLRNHWTLDIGILGYIGIVWLKEHSPEVWSVPPVTPCISQHMTIMRSQQMNVTTPNAMRSHYLSSNDEAFHVHESLSVYAAWKTLRLGKIFSWQSRKHWLLGKWALKKTDMCDKRWWRKYVRPYNGRQNFRKWHYNSTWQHLPLQRSAPGHELSKKQILSRA